MRRRIRLSGWNGLQFEGAAPAGRIHVQKIGEGGAIE